MRAFYSKSTRGSWKSGKRYKPVYHIGFDVPLCNTYPTGGEWHSVVPVYAAKAGPRDLCSRCKLVAQEIAVAAFGA